MGNVSEACQDLHSEKLDSLSIAKQTHWHDPSNSKAAEAADIDPCGRKPRFIPVWLFSKKSKHKT
jgi:hypothetical protein